MTYLDFSKTFTRRYFAIFMVTAGSMYGLIQETSGNLGVSLSPQKKKKRISFQKKAA